MPPREAGNAPEVVERSNPRRFGVRRRLQAVGLIGVAILLGIEGIETAESWQRHRAVREIDQHVHRRTEALRELTAALGYTGFIHAMKNYVLRGEQRYVHSFEKKKQQAYQAIEHYRTIDGISPLEAAAIDDIDETVAAYVQAMEVAGDMRALPAADGEPYSAEEIDDAVRISDERARLALATLSDERNRVQAEAIEQQREILDVLSTLRVALTAAGALGFLLVATVLTRRITRPVINLGDEAEIDADLAASFVHDSPAEVVVFNEDLHIEVASKSWLEMFNVTADVFGKPLDEVFPVSGTRWYARFTEAFAGRESSCERELLEESVSHNTWVRWALRPLASPPGEARRAILYIAPVGEIVELEDALRTAWRVDLAIEGANDGLWDWPDVTRKAAWWSPQFYRLLGYEPDEIPSTIDNFNNIVHSDDRDRVGQELQHTIDTNAMLETEYRLRMKTGEYRWFCARGRMFEDSEGKRIRMAGSLQDVHDRVLAQQEAEHSRTELRLILDAIPAFVYFKDDHNTILNANKAAADAVGKSVEEIIGHNVSEFFTDEVAEAFLHRDQEVIASGEPQFGIVQVHETRDGVRRIIRTDKLPLRDDTGVCRALVAVSTDITDEQARTEELRVLSRRLVLALQGARQGAWDWDLRTNEVVYSDTWFTILGYEPGELPMTYGTWAQLVHPDDLERVQRAINCYIEGESPAYEVEMRMRQRDGSWRWMRAIGRGFDPDDEGEWTRLAGMNIDIDEAKRLQTELAQKNEELERFVYTASHDLKSPIVTILGFLSRLRRDVEEGHFEKLDNHAERIARATERMRGNVDALLELCRVGNAEAEVERVRVADAVQATIDRCAANIEESGAQVEIDVGDCAVQVAPIHLEQVVDNYVSNALRYGCTGPSPRVRISAVTIGAYVEIRVDDNGPGIQPEHAKRVFGLFERLSNDKQSTGVGLALVSRVAARYGGDAWVEPAPGEGGRFRITLPVAHVDAVKSSPQPRASESAHER